MSHATPQSEAHWYSSHVEDQPPRDLVISLQCLVQEARGRLGPGATRELVLADLQERGLEVNHEDVARVWDDLC